MKRMTTLALVLSVAVSGPLFAMHRPEQTPRRRPPYRIAVHGKVIGWFLAAGEMIRIDAF